MQCIAAERTKKSKSSQWEELNIGKVTDHVFHFWGHSSWTMHGKIAFVGGCASVGRCNAFLLPLLHNNVEAVLHRCNSFQRALWKFYSYDASLERCTGRFRWREFRVTGQCRERPLKCIPLMTNCLLTIRNCILNSNCTFKKLHKCTRLVTYLSEFK